jgi:L-ascorbate metabolism protein UlaG (beta-lactamase superfamily)
MAEESADLAHGITWLGHDSFRIEGAKTVYIDPWKLGTGAPPADVVLVTHEHSDHLSAADIDALSTPETVVVGPAEVTRQLRGRKTRTVAPGDTVELDGARVTAVAAYNTSKFREPGKVFHPKEDGKVGYVVEMDGRSVYHAGDTDQIPEMAAIDVDVALIPVSGTYVMTADEAAEACSALHARLVIPMHYGDIVGSADDARRFARTCSLPVKILPESDR